MAMVRLEGSNAMAKAIEAELEAINKNGKNTVMVFDFDRTLTNGFADDKEKSIDRLVRGGTQTIQALEKASRHEKVALYIITARKPHEMTIQQLYASLDNAQSALKSIFRPDHAPSVITEFEYNQVPLAKGGSIYASDYQKSTALAHILHENELQENFIENVLFFDDTVVNSHTVAESLSRNLKDCDNEAIAQRISLKSFWWDSYHEEIVMDNPTMRPIHFKSSDFNYHEFYAEVLSKYGINESTRMERLLKYQVVCKDWKYDDTGSESKTAQQVSKIKDTKKFNMLADMLSKRK